MRRYLLLALLLLLGLLPLKAQDFSLADILVQSASADNAEFTILLFALGEADAGLLTQLNAPNANLTILAPSDAAFVEFMREYGLSLRDLVDNPLLLDALVRYHILAARLSSAEIAASENLLSLSANNPIFVSMQRNSLRLNGTAEIVRDGFVANNGILHLIDEVLVPPTVHNLLLNRQGNPATASQNLMEVLQSRPDLSSLTLALEQNGLLETFADTSQSFTLFAPNNAAFEASGLSIEAITGENLLYHAFENTFLGADLLLETSHTSLQGAALELSYSAGSMVLNGNTLVVEMDIVASNGVLHVINALLAIPSTP